MCPICTNCKEYDNGTQGKNTKDLLASPEYRALVTLRKQLCTRCGQSGYDHLWRTHPHENIRLARCCTGFEITIDESFED